MPSCSGHADADAFLVPKLDVEVLGGGAITSHGGRVGFIGLFIVRPEFRRRGLGSRLWQARRWALQERLLPGVSIGMDGIFGMQAWYASRGFAFSDREIRFEGLGRPGA